MAENKSRFNLFALFLLLSLNPPNFLICQQIVHADMIFNSDYEIFRELPENKIYPSPMSYTQNLLGSSIDLFFTKIDDLCVDSSFVIDTIYYHSYDNEDNFKEYRRFFNYDKFYRINSVTAEIFKDSSWLVHQITNVSYNPFGKVKQINHIRNQHPFDDTLIIRNEYNEDNLIVREIRENLDSSYLSWNMIWAKNYTFVDGNLTGYYLEKIKEFYMDESDHVDIKYNLLGLPIERIEYKLDNTTLVNDYKFVWNYNEKNLLSEKHGLWGNSDKWESSSNEFYKYDNRGNLVEASDEYIYDPDTLRGTQIFYYSVFLDSIIYTSRSDKNEFDSLLGRGSTTFEYDSCGYLMGYKMLSFYKAKESRRGVIIKRDEYHNIVFIQEEFWHNNKSFPEDNTRIIYRRKNF